MTDRRANRRGNTAPHSEGDLVSFVGGTSSAQHGGVTIIFTDEQIAYLDERMRLANQIRPMGRVGGSSLHRYCPDGSHIL